MLILPTRAATHDDLFHADDVLVGALLRALSPAVDIVRTRDAAILASLPLVYDVGGVCDPATGRLDHHLPDPPRRPDGSPLSSLGLVWALMVPTLADLLHVPAERAAALGVVLESRLVRTVDHIDCGEWDRAWGPTPAWYGALTSERPVWDEQPADPTAARAIFDIGYERQTLLLSALLRQLAERVRAGDAPDVVVTALLADVERLGEPANARHRASRERAVPVLRALLQAHGGADEPLLLPNPALPWREALRTLVRDDVPQAVSHVLFTGLDELWTVVAVPRTGVQGPTALFPPPWRGLTGEALAQATGLVGAVFCHQGGFLAKFDGEESARAAAAIARAAARAVR